MTKKQYIKIIKALVLLVISVLFTIAVFLIDRQGIAPDGSDVGFAGLNKFVYGLLGSHKFADVISDILSLISILIAFCFAMLGLYQWIKRRNIFKVDGMILCLGVVYSITILLYIVFDLLVVNVGPMLDNGEVSPSFPSSHTMTILCIFMTAAYWCKKRITNDSIRGYSSFGLKLAAGCLVVFRLLSGMHWFTDIIGGLLYALSFLALYKALIVVYNKIFKKKN